MPEPKILLSGLGIPESPRWHQGSASPKAAKSGNASNSPRTGHRSR
jgi:hypothetical protein